MTSKHTFEENSDPLAKLDYGPLLDAILQELKSCSVFQFSPDGNKLRIGAYDIAYKIATNKAQQQLNALTQSVGVRAATVNFSAETEFYSKIQAIRDELKRQLDTAAGDNQTKARVENLCTDISQFNSTKAALPFSYPFTTSHTFRAQRLIVENSLAEERRNGTESVIKAHHLNVRFEGLSQFNEKLSDSLKAYIDSIASPNSQDWEELNELLANLSEREDSALNELRKIVDTESLPRLLRDVKIDYLEYLKGECAKTNLRKTNSQGFDCLEALIARLKLLSNYINDSNDDSHYEVTYLGETVNLRTAFSQANAFDMLPIIPEYEGVIGESVDKDKGVKEFNLGVRLKLNGAVNVYDEDSTLNYYMTELDPNSNRHKEQLNDPAKAKTFKRKILTIACLYYFIFASDNTGEISDKNYNPIKIFETEILNQLRPNTNGTTDNTAIKLFDQIRNFIFSANDWNVSNKMKSLKGLFQDLLKQKTVWPSFSKSVHLCIHKEILKKKPDKILNSRNFFSLDLHQEDQSQAKAKAREALAYIEVMPPEVNLQSLTSLAVTFTFDDVRYFKDGDLQKFSMSHDISGIKALPVVFSPIGVSKENGKPIYHRVYEKYFVKQKIIVVYYKSKEVRDVIFKNSQSPEARIYRHVFTILTYLCLSLCREQISERVFMPLIRFHLTDIQNTTEDEVFLNSLSKALAHILRRDCLADAQGLNIKNFGQPEDKSFEFRVQQALSSMYALVPKTFEFQGGAKPLLEKLAIIVVSSWLSDAVWNEKDKTRRISNIYGEIIVINKVSETAVKIEPLKTFSDTETHERMYRKPEIVRDEITKLYQQGYRHFLYIAKAPYTRSLGITQLEYDPDSLFFMSQDVISYLKQGKSDIKLYPIFMDTYPAINLTDGKVDSFYIPDIEELEKLSVDKSQKTRVFLNLFTGRSVDKKRTFFNSVVCYSTLLNIYDVSDTRDIMSGLLDKNSPLQQTILQYITLFHFSRYEVNRNIAFKLNPYSKLIGDEGIGTISTYSYTARNIKFNNLAFLTSIRSALYGK